MTQYIKTKTEIFMSQIESLKQTFATEQIAMDTARLLYPGNNSTSRSNRSLFMRVFRAPFLDFERAVRQWKKEGLNFGEIAKRIPGRQKRGAPEGNKFAATHRRTSALPRCQSAWNAMTEAEKLHFMEANGLTCVDGQAF